MGIDEVSLRLGKLEAQADDARARLIKMDAKLDDLIGVMGTAESLAPRVIQLESKVTQLDRIRYKLVGAGALAVFVVEQFGSGLLSGIRSALK